MNPRRNALSARGPLLVAVAAALVITGCGSSGESAVATSTTPSVVAVSCGAAEQRDRSVQSLPQNGTSCQRNATVVDVKQCR